MSENDFQQILQNLTEENLNLKKQILSDSARYYNEISQLKQRIEELEDWNDDRQEQSWNNFSIKSSEVRDLTKEFDEFSQLKLNLDLLNNRNRELENEIQRLQSQQRNNQLSLERLDEYEETINQLQDQIELFQMEKKKSNSNQIEMDEFARILNENRSKWNLEIEQLRSNLNEKEILLNKEKEIRLKEIERRESIENQFHICQNETIELRRQIERSNENIQSKENQIKIIQENVKTAGDPPTSQTFSEKIICENEKKLSMIFNQFRSLLPDELSKSNGENLSLIDEFHQLFDQLSSYIGTCSIVQQEFDSIKQILSEKQNELDQLQEHFEQLQPNFVFEENENSPLFQLQIEEEEEEENFDRELREFTANHQRTPSQQSILSLTPGEKQQLIAQNEILSSLLKEKEKELISLQQMDKIHLENVKTIERLETRLREIEEDRQTKQIELNEIKNILDEKIRENSSLKKEKFDLIERFTKLQREKQDQIDSNEQQIDQNFSEENLEKRCEKLEIDLKNVENLLKQKSEGFVQCQNELIRFQNLFYNEKQRNEQFEQIKTKFEEKQIEFNGICHREQILIKRIEFLENQIRSNENLKKNFQEISEKFEENQLELKRSINERNLSIVEKKLIEKQFEEIQDKLFSQEEKDKVFKHKIDELQRFNEQIRKENEILIQQIDFHVKNEENLQKIVQEFQQNREENLKETLIRYENLLEEKSLLIVRLINEKNELENKFVEFSTRNKSNLDESTTNKIDKQIVKNILISFFQTPFDKQLEVIPLIGALLDFTNQESQRAIQTFHNHQSNSNNKNKNNNHGWFSTILRTNDNTNRTQTDFSNKSFTELLIQFVDQQSKEENESNDGEKQISDNEKTSTRNISSTNLLKDPVFI